jgi:hypothetical protein
MNFQVTFDGAWIGCQENIKTNNIQFTNKLYVTMYTK